MKVLAIVTLSLTEEQNEKDSYYYPNMKIKRPVGSSASKLFWTGAVTGKDYWIVITLLIPQNAQIKVDNLADADYWYIHYRGSSS